MLWASPRRTPRRHRRRQTDLRPHSPARDRGLLTQIYGGVKGSAGAVDASVWRSGDRFSFR